MGPLVPSGYTGHPPTNEQIPSPTPAQRELFGLVGILLASFMPYVLGSYTAYTGFFIACILIGLEYMHNNGVIHRDLKPENLLMEASGYVCITDLGISRELTPENS